MKIAGMKTDSIFRRYNIVDGADIEAALAKTVFYVESGRRERVIRVVE